MGTVMFILTRGYGTTPVMLMPTRGYGGPRGPVVWACRDINAYLEREIDAMAITEHSLFAECVLELDYKLRAILEEKLGGLVKLEENFKIWVRWRK